MINITLEQAKEIVADRSNGGLEGISSGKGGRAWLDGEWQLCELEALCVIIRHEAGDGADGAEDLATRMQEDADEQQVRAPKDSPIDAALESPASMLERDGALFRVMFEAAKTCDQDFESAMEQAVEELGEGEESLDAFRALIERAVAILDAAKGGV